MRPIILCLLCALITLPVGPASGQNPPGRDKAGPGAGVKKKGERRGQKARPGKGPEKQARPLPKWVKVDEEAFGNYVDQVRSTMRIPAVSVAVVHKDKGVVFARGFGEVNGAPVGPETPFVIGPLSQTVVAAAALKLVEEGKLSLDAPVREVLPKLRVSGQGAQSLTLRHLLLHRSGISTEDGISFWAAGQQEGLPEVVLVEAPGGSRRPSALNHAVVGAMVEKASGRAVEEYVGTELFEKLGMVRTGLGPEALEAAAPGHQYHYALSARGGAESVSPAALPSGFVVSTGRDMARWLLWQMGGEGKASADIMDRGAVEALFGGAPEGGASWNEALGWSRDTAEPGAPLLCSGQTALNSAAMAIYPDHGLGIVVLTNINSFGAMGPEAILAGFVELLLTRSTKVFAYVEIVVRLVVGLLFLMTFLDLGRQLWRLRRYGRSSAMVWSRARLMRLSLALGLPLAILIGALALVPIPTAALFEFQPDLFLALALACPVAAVKGTLKILMDAREAELLAEP